MPDSPCQELHADVDRGHLPAVTLGGLEHVRRDAFVVDAEDMADHGGAVRAETCARFAWLPCTGAFWIAVLSPRVIALHLTGCAFAWLLLLLSAIVHAMHYCGGDEGDSDDEGPNTMYS